MSFATSTTFPGIDFLGRRPEKASTLAEIVEIARMADALALAKLNNGTQEGKLEHCRVLLHSAIAVLAFGTAGSTPMSPGTVLWEIRERGLPTPPDVAAYDELCYRLFRLARGRDSAGARLSVAVIMDTLRDRLARWGSYLTPKEMRRLEEEVCDAEVALTSARA